MKKFKLALLMVLAVAGFNSCSSDDEKKSNLIEGGTVHTSQLVAISSENLSQDIYEGIFNDAPVQLANNDSGGLVFFVQPDLALVGEKNILEIPALKMKINYTVKQTALPGTPEEALAPLFDNINKLDTSGFAEGEKVNGFLDNFKSYYASLSEAEKMNIAEFYHANLDLFFLTMQGLAQPKGFLGLTNCETSVWVFLTSASAAVILFNPAALGPSIVAMVVAISSLVVGVRECDLFRMQEIKQIFAKFGDLESSRPGKSQEVSRGQAKGMGGALKFVHGEPKGFEAVNVRRSLQASDVADTNPIIAKFFSLVETLNNFVVEKVNVALEYYNSKVPSFFEKELLEKPIVMPENGKVGNEAFDQEVFDAFTFSVGSSDVGLSSISFANGKVNMTFNMADPNAGEISTTLDYVFKDEFNEREGSFPIVVSSGQGGNGIFTDAAAVKAIRVANGLDVSDPRWDSNVENEVIALLEENSCGISNSRVYTVDMYDMGLTVLPPEIGNLTNLKYLSLSGNQLTGLPAEIGNLTNLTELSLYSNQLASLPSTIGNLTNLIYLEIYSNQLTSLPSTIGNLNQLEYLYIAYNQLNSIPSTMGSLINLTVLDCTDNLLTDVPPQIGNLTNLTYLSVQDNQLKCLPPSVWAIDPAQTIINYSGNFYTQNGETYGLCYFGDTDCSNNPCP